MKRIIWLAKTFLMGIVFMASTRALAQEEAAPTLPPFHDQLAAFGTWSHSDDTGWIWAPSAVPSGWRPYSQGRWEFAEGYGPIWMSSLPWGDVVFHYGRWDHDEARGWFWTPGTTWAPAWVAWRRGEGYIGWAPLPRAVTWDESGIGSTADANIGPNGWTFADETAFLAPRSVVITPSVAELLERTSDVTGYALIDGRIVNQNLTLDEVEAFTRSVVRPVRVAAAEPAKAEMQEEAEAVAEGAEEPEAPEEAVIVLIPEEAFEPPVPLRYQSSTVVHTGHKWSLHNDQPWSYTPTRSWQYHPPRRNGYQPKRDWTYTPVERRPYLTRQDWTYHRR